MPAVLLSDSLDSEPLPDLALSFLLYPQVRNWLCVVQHSFHPHIQDEVTKLREAIAKESWDQKGKFPPTLKPLLSSLAIRLDEYDDHFFNLMPTLFPYNKFTMSKLIKRTVFQDHIALLTERQDALLVELAAQAKEGFAKAEEEWNPACLHGTNARKNFASRGRCTHLSRTRRARRAIDD
ncbi:hypothetical protein DXG03_001534 [Asterophora parasitica]|uniref:Ubinuclein middle domain-containing protein n=1 Tax=Asterophora parasitica TaxID=117018 RepID=A0A9P7K6D2_9AGAR|nr:hypothetical protein DXG03_001534 [Asterophora parasitica]